MKGLEIEDLMKVLQRALVKDEFLRASGVGEEGECDIGCGE